MSLIDEFFAARNHRVYVTTRNDMDGELLGHIHMPQWCVPWPK